MPFASRSTGCAAKGRSHDRAVAGREGDPRTSRVAGGGSDCRTCLCIASLAHPHVSVLAYLLALPAVSIVLSSMAVRVPVLAAPALTTVQAGSVRTSQDGGLRHSVLVDGDMGARRLARWLTPVALPGRQRDVACAFDAGQRRLLG